MAHSFNTIGNNKRTSISISRQTALIVSVVVNFLLLTTYFRFLPALCNDPKQFETLVENESLGGKNVINGTRETEGEAKLQLRNASKNSIDALCPRFATMKHKKHAGLGHKFAEVVFGMILAEETNSTYVFDDSTWSLHGTHGSYSWLMDFLPLHNSEVTLSEFELFSTNHGNIVTVSDNLESLLMNLSRDAKYACNVFFTTSMDRCCPGEKCWCTFQPSRVGSYDRIKWRIREAFSRSSYVPSQHLLDFSPAPKDEPIISIAWHVRQGDLVLNANKEHFERLASQIATVLYRVRELPVHFFIMGESNITRDFPFLPGLCEHYFQGNCSYLHLDVRDTLYHMVESDVLITSGSSFPVFAALLRTSGLILYEYPKEMVTGIFETSGEGLINPNGTIEVPSLRDLEYRLQIIFDKKVKELLSKSGCK